MSQKTNPIDDFFLNPPWRILFGGLICTVLCICTMLRISELGEPHIEQACRFAVWITVAGGAAGLYPVLLALTASPWKILAGTFIGSVIRMLVVVIGILILLLMTEISPGWLILFSAKGYVLFLTLDTVLAILLIQRRGTEDLE